VVHVWRYRRPHDGFATALLFDRLSWVVHRCELGDWPAVYSLFAGLAIRLGDQDCSHHRRR
jgi:hypothetical protein